VLAARIWAGGRFGGQRGFKRRGRHPSHSFPPVRPCVTRSLEAARGPDLCLEPGDRWHLHRWPSTHRTPSPDCRPVDPDAPRVSSDWLLFTRLSLGRVTRLEASYYSSGTPPSVFGPYNYARPDWLDPSTRLGVIVTTNRRRHPLRGEARLEFPRQQAGPIGRAPRLHGPHCFPAEAIDPRRALDRRAGSADGLRRSSRSRELPVLRREPCGIRAAGSRWLLEGAHYPVVLREWKEGRLPFRSEPTLLFRPAWPTKSRLGAKRLRTSPTAGLTQLGSTTSRAPRSFGHTMPITLVLRARGRQLSLRSLHRGPGPSKTSRLSAFVGPVKCLRRRSSPPDPAGLRLALQTSTPLQDRRCDAPRPRSRPQPTTDTRAPHSRNPPPPTRGARTRAHARRHVRGVRRHRSDSNHGRGHGSATGPLPTLETRVASNPRDQGRSPRPPRAVPRILTRSELFDSSSFRPEHLRDPGQLAHVPAPLFDT